jgi:predicted RND superfamily exporter protein
MGLTGVHLDIGTSMLACLVLGAGVDYALHLVSAWKAPAKGSLEDAAAEAAAHTGPAIWINAVMIAAGFAVLTLGTAKPLQNVGSLTAASLMTAAAATFLTIPVLARRRSYGRLSAEEIADADDGALVGEKPDLPTNTNTRS